MGKAYLHCTAQTQASNQTYRQQAPFANRIYFWQQSNSFTNWNILWLAFFRLSLHSALSWRLERSPQISSPRFLKWFVIVAVPLKSNDKRNILRKRWSRRPRVDPFAAERKFLDGWPISWSHHSRQVSNYTQQIPAPLPAREAVGDLSPAQKNRSERCGAVFSIEISWVTERGLRN